MVNIVKSLNVNWSPIKSRSLAFSSEYVNVYFSIVLAILQYHMRCKDKVHLQIFSQFKLKHFIMFVGLDKPLQPGNFSS